MKYLLTLLIIGATFFAKAQEEYLITHKGDTIFGETIILQGTNYDQVRIKHSEGKDMFPAFKVLAVVKGDDVYEPIVYNGKRIMAQVLAKGKMSHYGIRPKDGPAFNERILYKDENAFQLSSIGFRKRISEYIGDCESLKSKIEEKELGFTDIDVIIKEYNNCGELAVAMVKEEKVETTAPQINHKELMNFSQLVLDITTKLENGEDIPSYMIDALSKYSETSIDEKVKELLSRLDKN